MLDVVERSLMEDESGGSGLYTVLQGYQEAGLYFLVFPLKALHLLFAKGLKFQELLAPGNIYNDVFVGLHSTMTLVMFLALLWQKKFSMRSDLIYASVVFLAVFCLSPIYAPRYLYPVYVAWVLVLAGAPMQLTWPRRRRRHASAQPAPTHRDRCGACHPSEESMIYVHPSAIVDQGASIGDFTSIWHFCHVESRAIVGENCNLGQNVYVGNNAVVGNGCRLGNTVSVFSHVELGDFVFCAPFMVFTQHRISAGLREPARELQEDDREDRRVARREFDCGAGCDHWPRYLLGRGRDAHARQQGLGSDGGYARSAGCLGSARMVRRFLFRLEGSGEWRCGHTGDTYVLEGAQLVRHAGRARHPEEIPALV